MGKIYQNIEELIGRIPLLEVAGIEKELGLLAKILVKLEYLNPAGSVKDRAAKFMIEDAEAKGFLKEGSVIVEPTSGNTGIGLAALAAAKGYRMILTMPETMSVERRNILKAYGAELVLTEGGKGMKGAIEKAQELAAEIPGSFLPGQFDNQANAEAHRRTTGPEIWEDTEGKADILVAGVGTGGTITGAGEYLKSRNAGIYIVAVEPADSPVLSGGEAGPHKLQGIGAGFVPRILNTEIYDEQVPKKRSRLQSCWQKKKGFWLGSLQERPCPQRLRWQRGRKTREKQSWRFSRTVETDTILLLSLWKSRDGHPVCHPE